MEKAASNISRVAMEFINLVIYGSQARITHSLAHALIGVESKRSHSGRLGAGQPRGQADTDTNTAAELGTRTVVG